MDATKATDLKEQHAQRVGRNLRGLLNDLKRDPQAAAKDLGVAVEDIESYIAGRAEIPLSLIKKAVALWPVNERDFFLMHDDAPDGVVFLDADASKRSSRVFQRKGADYYEYRDTAMSRLAMFRPEWIQELCIVNNNDPEHPAVQWNNGHFLHQFTYFIGPVNFYYMDGGKKRVAVMNTGDSMYITPFVPHTFTTRENEAGEKGLILAVTCGDKIMGDAQAELSAIGPHLAKGFALDFETRETAFGGLLQRHVANATMDAEALAGASKLPLADIEAWLRGDRVAAGAELEALARALRVQTRDLLPPDEVATPVIVQGHADARTWNYPSGAPAYKVAELATNAAMPHARPLELTLLQGGDDQETDIEVGLHQWCFNAAPDPVRFTWAGPEGVQSRLLAPGDSLYVKPFVAHAFRATTDREARLVTMRIGGKMAGDPTRELSTLGRANVERVIGETQQWYDPKGRS